MDTFTTRGWLEIKLLPVGHKGVFKSPYSDMHPYNGMRYEVVEVQTEADERCDAEMLPMYEVNIADKNGNLTRTGIDAFPEELTEDQAYWSHSFSGEFGAG